MVVMDRSAIWMEWITGFPGPHRVPGNPRVVWRHWRLRPAHSWWDSYLDPRKQTAGRGRRHLRAPGPRLRDDPNAHPDRRPALAHPGCSPAGGTRSDGSRPADREALPAPQVGWR